MKFKRIAARMVPIVKLKSKKEVGCLRNPLIPVDLTIQQSFLYIKFIFKAYFSFSHQER